MAADALEQGAAEPLADYVKRLEGELARPIRKELAGGPSLSARLRAAKKSLAAVRADAKKTPAVRQADVERRGPSPALREMMRLFPRLTAEERQEFFVWYANGMREG